MKLYFIHIPKTAGNSVRAACRKKLSNSGAIKAERVHHFAIRNAARIVDSHRSFKGMSYFPCYLEDKKFINSDYSFSVVRNPFDLLVSYYLHDAHGTNKDDGWANVNKYYGFSSFEQFVEAYCTLDPDEWHVPSLSRCLYAPIFNIDGNIEVDFVLRFENLKSNLKEMFNSIGMKKKVFLPRKNTTSRRKKQPYKDFYSTRTKELVEKKCGWILENFEYSFEGGEKSLWDSNKLSKITLEW